MENSTKGGLELYDFQEKTIRNMMVYESMNFDSKLHNQVCNINTKLAVLGNNHGSGKTFTYLHLILRTLGVEIKNNYKTQNQIKSILSKDTSRSNDISIVVYNSYAEDFIRGQIPAELKYLFVKDLNNYNSYSKVLDLYISDYNIIFISNKVYSYMFSFFYEVYTTDNIKFKRIIYDCSNSITHYGYSNFIKENIAMFIWYIEVNYDRLYYDITKTHINISREDFYLLVLRSCNPIEYKNKMKIIEHVHEVQVNKSSSSPWVITKELKTKLKNNIEHGKYLNIIHYLQGIVKTPSEVMDKYYEEMENQLDRGKISYAQYNNYIKNRAPEIELKVKDVYNQTCYVCLDSVSNPVVLGCCYSIICLTCYIEILFNRRFSCPMCRSPIVYILGVHEGNLKLPSEEEKLLEYLEKYKKEKILIVSTQGHIEPNIRKKYKIKILAGRYAEKTLREFNEEKITKMVYYPYSNIPNLPIHGVKRIFVLSVNLEDSQKKNILDKVMNCSRQMSDTEIHIEYFGTFI